MYKISQERYFYSNTCICALYSFKCFININSFNPYSNFKRRSNLPKVTERRKSGPVLYYTAVFFHEDLSEGYATQMLIYLLLHVGQMVCKEKSDLFVLLYRDWKTEIKSLNCPFSLHWFLLLLSCLHHCGGQPVLPGPGGALLSVSVGVPLSLPPVHTHTQTRTHTELLPCFSEAVQSLWSGHRSRHHLLIRAKFSGRAPLTDLH